MKRWMALLLAAGMSAGMSVTSFADWEWHDADGDGQEACYYFLEDGSLLKNTRIKDQYRVNENGLWTENGIVQTRQGQVYDMDAVIKEIRGLYADINSKEGQYRVQKGYSDEYQYYVNEKETAYYSADEVLRKRVVPGEFNTEVYYYGPSDSGYKPEMSNYDNLAFLFAYDKQGNEYRIYFRDGEIVRYIGPDHNTVDFPGGIGFLNLVKLEEELNGGENIYRLLSVADAGWWISYEGENNGFAEMTEE